MTNTVLTWQPIANAASQIPAELYSWMADANSMTARMRRQGDVYLKLLEQQEMQLLDYECEFFGLTQGERGLIRLVEMGFADQPFLYGRTFFSPQLLHSEYADRFTQLGTNALGEVLFQDPGLTRSSFDVTEIPSESANAAWYKPYLDEQQTLWARRSIFHYHRLPILLTEVFPTTQIDFVNRPSINYPK